MNSLFSLAQATWHTDLSSDRLYQVGHAAGWLSRGYKQASVNYPLSGRLYLAKSGWLLLSVPNALVRGVFDAMTAPGAELPLAGTMNVPNVSGDVLNAHISVMTADEVSSIGANKINERGHHFGYSLGPVHEIDAKNIDGVSKVWAIQVTAPGLSALRKSYGLSPLPKGDQPFHITVAVRRTNVLGNNGVSKFDGAAGRGELKAAAAAPWATFVIAPHDKGYAATTRPTGDGKFGLPGGKLEPGEDPLAAVQREAQEEGWAVSDVHPEPLHKSDVDGKPVWWYRAAAAKLLKDFKEKGRVVPATARADQLTEFGNDKALQLYQAALKTAGVYNFEGEVQGVSMRKTLHKILEELKRPGLMYNNAHTGEARAVLPGNKKQQQEVLDLLRQRLADRAAENARITGRPGEAKIKKPLQEGVDYKITPVTTARERMHAVQMTPDDIQNFIRSQGFNRLAAENPEYQKQWLGERYRLQPDSAGNLIGAVPSLAKKQLFKGEPIYAYQTVPGWNDEIKAAAADPDTSILISGHSGAGKSTLSKALAEKLHLPLHHADKHPDFTEFFNRPGRVNGAETIPGTPEYEEFQKLRKRVGEEVLANASGPSVIEGIQLAALPPEQLQRYKHRIYVQTPIAQLLKQRFERQRARAEKKGRPWAKEELPAQRQLGRQIFDAQKSIMDNYASLPGTLKYKTYKTNVDDIIEQLKLKTAADIFPGGEADNVPDSAFPKSKLQEGAEHEHEHTSNDQIAKEIAKDHLSEDPRYYEKQEALEKASQPQIIKELLEAKSHSDNRRYDNKAAILRRLMEKAPHDWEIDDPKPRNKGITHKPTKFRFHTPPETIPQAVKAAQTSVYLNQLRNSLFDRNGFQYDFNKPVFENIRNQLLRVKQQGDWILQARRNNQIYQASIDPQYRHQLALQAFHGTMPQPSLFDQSIERYGNNLLGGFK